MKDSFDRARRRCLLRWELAGVLLALGSLPLSWEMLFGNKTGEGEVAAGMIFGMVIGPAQFILISVLFVLIAHMRTRKFRRSNQASDATSEPAPSADSSSHQG